MRIGIWLQQDEDLGVRGGGEVARAGSREASRAVDKTVSTAATSPKSTNVFAKVNLYANSRLPPWLPPLKLYAFLTASLWKPLTCSIDTCHLIL